MGLSAAYEANQSGISKMSNSLVLLLEKKKITFTAQSKVSTVWWKCTANAFLMKRNVQDLTRHQSSFCKLLHVQLYILYSCIYFLFTHIFLSKE